MKLVFLCVFLASCTTSQIDQNQSASQNNENDCTECETECGYDKTLICHVPEGNYNNPQTLCIGDEELHGHKHHEIDYCGECEPQCGDESCHTEAENCEVCSEDCGECPPECGDFVCNGEETCDTCNADCGSCELPCGNGVCDENETCEVCASDCGECAAVCGDGTCGASETCLECDIDCGQCPSECGNGECESDEDCGGCPSDCGFCQPENPVSEPDPRIGVRGGGCAASGTSGLIGVLMVGLAILLFLHRHKWSKLFAIMLIVCAPLTAYAQDFDLERFEPGQDSHAILGVEAADTNPTDSIELMTWLNLSDDPLVLKNLDTGERLNDLVDYRAVVGLGGAYSINDNVQLGLSVPFSLIQETFDSADNNTTNVEMALGNITISPKIKLADESDVKLALIIKATLPTSNADNFAADRSTITPMLAVSSYYNRFRGSFNMGYRFQEKEQVLDLTVDDEALFGLGLAYGWGFGTEIAATLNVALEADNPFDRANRNYVEGMVGYRRYLAGGMSWFVGAGRGFSDGYGSPDWRAVAGLRVSVEGVYEEPCCGPLGPTEPPAPAPEPLPEPVPEPTPDPVPETITLVIPNTYFSFDKARIKPEYRQLLLDFAAKAVSFKGDLVVQIEGNTDSVGSSKYNQRLGQRRANSVSRILMKGGIPGSVMNITSAGETKPVDSNKTKAGRAKNRRVIIMVNSKADYQNNDPNEGTYDHF